MASSRSAGSLSTCFGDNFRRFGDDDIEARLWEIAENLHRADLSVLERSEHVAEWIKLSDKKEVLRQLDAKANGGRPESGTRKGAREIGVSEPDARRSLKVASLTPEAKQAARDTGRADNQAALLQAAKAPPEQQAETR